MKVFVWEYLSSGAYGEELLPASLLREGRAMLLAALKDFSRTENISLTTIWDSRLGPIDFSNGMAETITVHTVDDAAVVHAVDDASGEKALYKKCCEKADAVFLVAPEFDQILIKRVNDARKYCDHVLLSSNEMIELYSDKMRTANSLKEVGIPAIETSFFDIHQFLSEQAEESPFSPFVIKPIDGAGSVDTLFVQKMEQLKTLAKQPEFQNNASDESCRWISQPYLEGDSFSVAAIRAGKKNEFQIFPVARQKISDDSQFQYSGGLIPYQGKGSAEMISIVGRIMNQFPDLKGYIGFDFILPSENPTEPILLEINPRLTTSFIGYVELAQQSILGILINHNSEFSPIEWKSASIEFTSDGDILSIG